MKKPNIRRGQAPSVLKNQTTRRLATKPKSTGKGRRPNLSPLRTALRRADTRLMRALKEFRETLKDLENHSDYIGIERSALEEIIEVFESVRAYCDEDPERPFAAEIGGFATAAEHELCRFVTERSLLCQEIVEAVEMAEFDNDHSF
jgi:hypothetical protein